MRSPPPPFYILHQTFLHSGHLFTRWGGCLKNCRCALTRHLSTFRAPFYKVREVFKKLQMRSHPPPFYILRQAFSFRAPFCCGNYKVVLKNRSRHHLSSTPGLNIIESCRVVEENSCAYVFSCLWQLWRWPFHIYETIINVDINFILKFICFNWRNERQSNFWMGNFPKVPI